jgi:hypothetical protein
MGDLCATLVYTLEMERKAIAVGCAAGWLKASVTRVAFSCGRARKSIIAAHQLEIPRLSLSFLFFRSLCSRVESRKD